jgi:HPr kinase/phosphorylase
LLLGPSGAGKSDLLLRLLDYGFVLVADDQVCIVERVATAPVALAGLLEVRGLGIVKLPFIRNCQLVLAVELVRSSRLPHPVQHFPTKLPLVQIDPTLCSAPSRVALALDCALGSIDQLAGAFAC